MRNGEFYNWLVDATDLQGEHLPGQSLVEIAGDSRVLIEAHCGVKECNTERVRVNVRFGQILVCGSRLELSCMTREHLVICGKINSVMLQRRCE